jgi:hypothetical protein
VRFEDSSIVLTPPGFVARIETSNAMFVDTQIDVRSDAGRVAFDQSRVLLDRVGFGVGRRVDVGQSLSMAFTSSEALILDSTFRSGVSRGQILDVDAASSVVLAGSQLVDSSSGETQIRSAGSLFIWNSSFVNSISGRLPQAGVLVASGQLEIAASTFYGNRCAGGGESCPHDLLLDGCQAIIHNSLFVGAQPSIVGSPQLIGNCFTPNLGAFEVAPSPSGQVLASDHPCLDAGNASRLATSHQRLMSLAAPFVAFPFSVDLSRYESAEWWQNETVLVSRATDGRAPDPGRHFDPACLP